jgi:hypothetical protein
MHIVSQDEDKLYNLHPSDCNNDAKFNHLSIHAFKH